MSVKNSNRGRGVLSGSAFGRAGLSFVFSMGLSIFLPGCGKSGIAGELASWKDAGHAVSEFSDTDASAFSAKKCQTGTVDQLAVLLCEYSSADAAALARSTAERWGGDVGTVVVLNRAGVLFAVADRNHIDPYGKTISALTKVFRRAKKK
jgi:hypothetical protein